jgi:hypothetical protein
MVALLAPRTGVTQFISANSEVDKAFHSLSKSNKDPFNQGAGNIVAIMRRAGLSENFSAIGLKHETFAGGRPAIETEALHCRI